MIFVGEIMDGIKPTEIIVDNFLSGIGMSFFWPVGFVFGIVFVIICLMELLLTIFVDWVRHE